MIIIISNLIWFHCRSRMHACMLMCACVRVLLQGWVVMIPVGRPRNIYNGGFRFMKVIDQCYPLVCKIYLIHGDESSSSQRVPPPLHQRPARVTCGFPGLRWQMKKRNIKFLIWLWVRTLVPKRYTQTVPKRYPNGTLSHSWWMDGYSPVHMVVRGFDPYPLVIFGRIRLDVPSLPRCNKLLEGYPPACRPVQARILDIWFLEVGLYLHLCCLSWRSILKVRNWHSISIIYAHKKKVQNSCTVTWKP